MRRIALILMLVGGGVGCFQADEPLPPDEALVQLSARINGILADSRRIPKQISVINYETPDDPNKVLFWYFAHPLISPKFLSQRNLDAVFAQDHPGIQLDSQFIGEWNVAIQKLTVTIAAGDLPDIALVKRDWLARLVDAGLVCPLEDVAPASLIGDIREPWRQSLTINGRLYALPADGYLSVLYVNHDLLEDRPLNTWNDILEASRFLKTLPEGPSRPRFPVGYLPYLEMLWSAGGDVCDLETSRLDSPQALEALRYIVQARDEGLTSEQLLCSSDQSFGQFLGGQVAMTVASSARLPEAKKAPFAVDVKPVPGKNGPVSRLSDDVLVVFGRYSHEKGPRIGAVLDSLTGPAFQGEEAAAGGSVPTRTSIWESLRRENKLGPFGEFNAEIRGTPLMDTWTEIEFETSRYIEQAYRWKPAK